MPIFPHELVIANSTTGCLVLKREEKLSPLNKTTSVTLPNLGRIAANRAILVCNGEDVPVTGGAIYMSCRNAGCLTSTHITYFCSMAALRTAHPVDKLREENAVAKSKAITPIEKCAKIVPWSPTPNLDARRRAFKNRYREEMLALMEAARI